jgi:hypothetical protein
VNQNIDKYNLVKQKIVHSKNWPFMRSNPGLLQKVKQGAAQEVGLSVDTSQKPINFGCKRVFVDEQGPVQQKMC